MPDSHGTGCPTCAEDPIKYYAPKKKGGLYDYDESTSLRDWPDFGDPLRSRERYVRDGDILCFPDYGLHAFVTEEFDPDYPLSSYRNVFSNVLKLIWLDPENIDIRKENSYDFSYITRPTLEEMGWNEEFYVIKEDETSPDIWRDLISPPDTSADDNESHSIDIGLRAPAGTLSFEREFSLGTINGLLKHPLVNHKQGAISKGKAYFLAEKPDESYAATLVLNSPNPTNSFNRRTVEITRYASHWEGIGKESTATWMIWNACQWAALEGYSRVRTLAGTAGNDGEIYQLANFDYDGEAESSGQYNRDGRQNFEHGGKIRRYIRTITVDGSYTEDAYPPRRIETRLDRDVQIANSTKTLNAFRSSSNNAERIPDNFRFSREEVTDNKYFKSDDHPSFSPALQSLINETGTPITLETPRNDRRNDYPAAAFGAIVNNTLVASLLVGGDVTEKYSIARVRGYAARDTKWPQRTAQWLLTKAKNWAELNGYSGIHVPYDVFTHVDSLTEKLPKGVQIQTQTDSGYGTLFKDDTSVDLASLVMADSVCP